MKIIALDIGDQWTGIALSDALGLLAKPYKTVTTDQLILQLKELFIKERITQGVIGYPKTLRGTISEQTKKIEEHYEALKAQFPHIAWILWDERLSSKRAELHKKSTSKEEKQRSHAVAAAFILDSYLGYLHMHKNLG
ncbi:Holliday junction resolvase RuvX [Candidatus Dependentiae bacterium]|nr:Holliday junction resolvase RuvX [Candidatus Dependentiae bacterium]